MSSSYERLIKCGCGVHFNPAFNDDTQPMYKSCHYCKDEHGETIYLNEQVFEVVQYEILPCPFCKGRASTSSDGGVQHFAVHCNSCNAIMKRWGSSQEIRTLNLL